MSRKLGNPRHFHRKGAICVDLTVEITEFHQIHTGMHTHRKPDQPTRISEHPPLLLRLRLLVLSEVTLRSRRKCPDPPGLELWSTQEPPSIYTSHRDDVIPVHN